jgi:copper homeostasis protein
MPTDPDSELLIEAVACSADDCVEAEAGGADRVELCSVLVLGGLTPSIGTLIEARAATRLPIVCMIRPRTGGFCYTAREFAAMERDTEAALTHGAQGIVFGILDAEGRVDVARCHALVELAHAAASSHTVETVFHRAFDVTDEPFAALDALIDLGVTRVLTSGRARTALEGAPLLRALVERSAGRLEILPGGGIRDTNIADVVRATGLRQVHLGPFTSRPDPSGHANPTLTFSSGQMPPEGQFALADRDAIRRIRNAITNPPPTPAV